MKNALSSGQLNLPLRFVSNVVLLASVGPIAFALPWVLVGLFMDPEVFLDCCFERRFCTFFLIRR